jgi:hypothetical protein
VFGMTIRGRYDHLCAFSAGIVGTGAAFAVDGMTSLEPAGCDEAQGAGTRTRGGEDRDIPARTPPSAAAVAGERPAAAIPAPAGATRREFTGHLAGPWLYTRARSAAPA